MFFSKRVVKTNISFLCDTSGGIDWLGHFLETSLLTRNCRKKQYGDLSETLKASNLNPEGPIMLMPVQAYITQMMV